jgi:hypothetical protein
LFSNKKTLTIEDEIAKKKNSGKAWNISRYFSDHEFVYQYADGKEVTYQLRKVCPDF